MILKKNISFDVPPHIYRSTDFPTEPVLLLKIITILLQ